MDSDLRGKVALVTGATSGIGLATAEALASRGARVILGVRDVRAGQKAAKRIMADHPGAKVEVGPLLDLRRQESVKDFAAAINKHPGNLDILVNNAGIGYHPPATTEQGVTIVPQTNHLGPYTLTRLLERKLAQSRARVVFVSSVTHRFGAIEDPRAFMMDYKKGFYENTKLANVYTAFELQRRLGKHGVQACAADPGGVLTNIYKSSPKLSSGLPNFLITNTYAPPYDGAKAVVFAATCDWDATRPDSSSKSDPKRDLRYYCKGMFTWFPLTSDLSLGAQQGGPLGVLKMITWAMSTLWLSCLDWHARRLLPGVPALSRPKAARPAGHVWDEKAAAALWEVSAELAGVPKDPKV